MRTKGGKDGETWQKWAGNGGNRTKQASGEKGAGLGKQVKRGKGWGGNRKKWGKDGGIRTKKRGRDVG